MLVFLLQLCGFYMAEKQSGEVHVGRAEAWVKLYGHFEFAQGAQDLIVLQQQLAQMVMADG